MDIRKDKKELKIFAQKVGISAGLSEEDAFILADSLIFANLRGIDSHGIIRLPFYIKRLETKSTNAKPKIKKIKEKGGIIILDGDNGLGQIVGMYCANMAIEKAKEAGISFISTKRSSHFGAASYYSYHIAENNMFGISFSNGCPVMTAWGGSKRVIGNNPFSFATPYIKSQPILLDIAMSGVAGGKVRLYAKNNKKIPKGWILDKSGKQTDDPNDLVAGGTLLPFGEHKGYGLAIGLEILAGVLPGAAMMSQIPLWIKDFENPLNIGHCFIAIDLPFFVDQKEYNERISWMVNQLKSSPLSEGSKGVFLPGEIDYNIEKERSTKGIPISKEVWNDLEILAKKYKVEF